MSYPINLTNFISEGGFDGWKIEIINRATGQRDKPIICRLPLIDIVGVGGKRCVHGHNDTEFAAIYTRIAPSRRVLARRP